MFKYNIKARIILIFTLLSSLAIYYFSDWVSDSTRRHYLEAAEELMIDQVILLKSILIENTGADSERPDIEAYADYFKGRKEGHPEARIYEVLKHTTDTYSYVTDSEGGIMFHSKYPEKEGQSFAKWRNVNKALRGEYGARSTRDDEKDATTSILHVTYPLLVNKRIIGTVTLVKPVKRLSVYLSISQNKVARIAVITLVLFLVSGILLIWRIVHPIEKLTDYTNKIGDGEKPPLPKLPKGELQILGETIQDMKKNLDGKNYIESYIQGLTHELKSPIAAIQGASELMQSEKLSAEEKRLFENINHEAARMAEMVQKLLFLSRLENQNFERNSKKFSLADLMNEVIDDFKARFPKRQFKVNNSSKKEIKGDRLLLKTAVNNLLNNAIEFSDEDIQVNICNTSGRVELEIIDSGSGIPDYASDKIFDRFYSLPRPDSGAKSSGLGLAIVREIAELHKAEIKIANRNEAGGVRAALRFLPA